MKYFWNVGLGLTNLLNAILGGSPYESTSATAWRKHSRSRGWRTLQRTVDAAFALFGYPNHCRGAYESEQERRRRLTC